MPEYMVRYYYRETLRNYVENIVAIRYLDINNLLVSIVEDDIELKDHIEDMLGMVLENYLDKTENVDDIRMVLAGYAVTISESLMTLDIYDRLVNKIDDIITVAKKLSSLYTNIEPVAFSDLVFDQFVIDRLYFTISKVKNGIVEIIELGREVPKLWKRCSPSNVEV